MNWKTQIDKGIELLQLCSDLQSEKDGVDRPNINEIDKSKTLDNFAQDIQIAATNMAALYKLFPMMIDLAELGRKLEADGKIKPDFGDDYSRVVLDYLLALNGVQPTKR
jgi:hypothetical protein